MRNQRWLQDLFLFNAGVSGVTFEAVQHLGLVSALFRPLWGLVI